MRVARTRANVLLLAAQAVSLGIAAALLVIPSNGIFLAAYGADWLPATYIGIAALGAGASIVVARSLRRWTLPAVAAVVLAAMATTLLASWAIMVGTGSAWPSVIQLMMFPVLLQLGFVIIGGQAGRLLDLQQIKRYFPRVVSGFVVGFTIGGFGAVPLLRLLGEPEHLIVVSAASCAAFGVLVGVTARRRRAELTVIDQPTDDRSRPPLRTMLTSRFVVLVFAYQILSAMGSQVLDFLVFDRAAARYTDAAELTRFVAVFTGVLNAVDLLFLAAVAGWLLWRFGLRLGLVANPAVVTALTVGMLVAVVGPGAASLALFSIVVVARIVDIALTDGTTRGAINAVYQVLPVEDRLAVQASVEGVGVPVAIGATGVLLLAMNALDLGTAAIVVVAVVLCGVWTVVAVVTYRDYIRALGERLRRRGLDIESARPVAPDERSAVRRLLLTDDVRDIRLGLDLAVTANLPPADLSDLAEHGDPVVRLLALGQLAGRGDEDAAAAAGALARELAASDDPAGRRAAASALADLRASDHDELLPTLLGDPDASVRVAALGSVRTSDVGVVDLIVGSLVESATIDAALDAARRLGPPAAAVAAERLRQPGPVDPRLVRLVGALDASRPDVVARLAVLVTHPDRRVSTTALVTLARHGATVDATVLDALLADDAALAARTVAASTTMGASDEPIGRALADELELVRERTLGVLAVRHGPDRIGGARHALGSQDASVRALGVEMLQVSLSRREAELVNPLLLDDVDAAERVRRWRAVVEVPDRDRAAWLADLAVDGEQRWRSPWLQAVALHTELASTPDQAGRDARHIDASDTVDRALAEVVAVASASLSAAPSAE